MDCLLWNWFRVKWLYLVTFIWTTYNRLGIDRSGIIVIIWRQLIRIIIFEFLSSCSPASLLWSEFEKLSNASVKWERWDRCMMGIKPSQYLTTHSTVCTEQFICGDSCTHINLSDDSKYPPSLPYVSNITKAENLDAYFWTYTYDIRSIDLSEEELWVVRQAIST